MKLTDELIAYTQSMQAVGELVHTAIGRGDIRVVDGDARKMEEAQRGYYRELGVHDMDLGSVRTMARELAIWRAAAHVLTRGVVDGELVVGEEELVFAGGGLVLLKKFTFSATDCYRWQLMVVAIRRE